MGTHSFGRTEVVGEIVEALERLGVHGPVCRPSDTGPTVVRAARFGDVERRRSGPRLHGNDAAVEGDGALGRVVLAFDDDSVGRQRRRAVGKGV